jgi:hypothetical protein
MGGNKTAGFTKVSRHFDVFIIMAFVWDIRNKLVIHSSSVMQGAQKQKFIRNRDIKLKESELRKEDNTQRVMCEGICPKCREKVQWRFRYDKYKPLKNAATCQDCHQKTVTKAYRTLCDTCSSRRKCCSSCCGDLFAAVIANQPAKAVELNDITLVADGNQGLDGTDKLSDTESEASEDESELMNGAETSSEQQPSIPVTAAVTSAAVDIPCAAVETTPSGEVSGTATSADDWDVRKFQNMAANKYSKNRVVGSEEDRTFAFGLSGQLDRAVDVIDAPPTAP